jgi:uncharacterized DUF497 family protein
VSFFAWDEINIKHVLAHGVSVSEVEEALSIAPLHLDNYIVDGEKRSEEVGQTAAGRILKVILVSDDRSIRVITAFDASAHSKRVYLRSLVNI